MMNVIIYRETIKMMIITIIFIIIKLVESLFVPSEINTGKFVDLKSKSMKQIVQLTWHI